LNIDEVQEAKRGFYFAYFYNNLLPDDFEETQYDEYVDPFQYAYEDG
jgi:hypothetical protein